MRCRSCNVILNDAEATRKHSMTGEYLDLCNDCTRDVLTVSQIPLIGDLSTLFDYDDVMDGVNNDEL